jgi:hypothetical protein
MRLFYAFIIVLIISAFRLGWTQSKNKIDKKHIVNQFLLYKKGYIDGANAVIYCMDADEDIELKWVNDSVRFKNGL